MANWLQRLFTLPKAKNSLSDVLGSDRTALFRVLAAPLIEEVVEAVGNLGVEGVGKATLVAEAAAKMFSGTIGNLIGRRLSGTVEDEIYNTLEAAVGNLPNDPLVIRAVVERALYSALKL